MAAPTAALSGTATISATGESSGVLKTLGLPNLARAVALIGVSGSNFTTVVLAVRGRIAGQTVYYPLQVWTIAGTPVADSGSIALTDNTAVRFWVDVSGLDAYEVYAVSGTLTAALTVEETVLPGPPGVAVTNNTLSNQLQVATGGSINDAGGNELLKFPATVASAVNEVTVTNSATGNPVQLTATGGDTNVGVTINGKGSGVTNIGSVSTGIVTLGRGALKTPVLGLTKTDVNTQNAAPTIAQLLGGYVTHNSQTGAGTLTTPTGAAIDAGIAGVATGDSFLVVYQNRGNQTVTLTAGDGAVTVKGTAAIPTLKTALILFSRTGAGTWDAVNVLGA